MCKPKNILKKCFIPKKIITGIVIDISQEVEKLGTAARLQQKHLEDWELKNGPIPKNSLLLVKFGWAKYYSHPNVYLGGSVDHALNFPGGC